MAALTKVRTVSTLNLNLLRKLYSCAYCQVHKLNYSSSQKSDEADPLDLNSNPFLKKYEKKIRELQQSDPEEFTSRINTQLERKKKKWYDETKPPSPSLSGEGRPQLLQNASTTKVKTLDSIMKVDLLKDLSADDISKLWKDYHKDKDRICAVIPAKDYSQLYKRAIANPMFLYPLTRDAGFEFFFGQFDGQAFHFTSVINYQAYQENAPIMLSMVHYADLQDAKGIVLMSGEYSTDFLKAQDAHFFANQVQMYYLMGDDSHVELLRQFNHEPQNFKHMKVIEKLESKQFTLGGDTS